MARWWAVGEDGYITYSADGTSWGQISSPTSRYINAIRGFDPDNIWIGTHYGANPYPGGEIWYYNGSTWTLQHTLPTTDYVTSFWVVSDTEVYASTVSGFSGYGQVLKYNGSSWSQLESAASYYGIAVDGSTIMVAKGGGKQFRYTVTGGAPFSESAQSYAQACVAVCIGGGNYLYHFIRGNVRMYGGNDLSLGFPTEIDPNASGHYFRVSLYGHKIWSPGGKDMYILMDSPAEMLHWDGSTQTYTAIPNANQTMEDVFGVSQSDIKVASDNGAGSGRIHSYNGETYTASTSSPFPKGLKGIWGYEATEPVVVTPCRLPKIDSDFTLNHYHCLPHEHRDLSGNSKDREGVPFILGSKGLHIRKP